jgi:autotransporter-associated beta strand protein
VIKLRFSFALLAALCCGSVYAGTATWTGSADQNWSTGGNWSGGTGAGGIPAPGDAVVFGNGASVGTQGSVNNIVDSLFGGTIASLAYNNTSGFHTTQVAAGKTLNVNGALTAGTAGALNAFTNTITGEALAVSNNAANIIVQSTNRVGLDLSSLNTFTAAFSQLQLGVGLSMNGTLLLARTNAVTAWSTGGRALDIGDSSASQSGGSGQLYLGQSNAIFTDSILLGRGKSGNNLIAFNPAFVNPVAVFRGTNGTSSRVSHWSFGDTSINVGSGTPGNNQVADFTGGSLDALVNSLTIGQGGNSFASKNVAGTFTMTAGTLDVNTLYLGAVGTSGSASGSGTLNLSGATLNVNSLLTLGNTGGTTSSGTTGTLNASNATVRANSITVGIGSGTSTINLNNTTLVVSNTAGTPNSVIDKVTITNSTLQFSIPPALTTNLEAGTLTRGGSATVINIGSVTPIVNYPVTFRLIKYSTLAGTLNFTLGSMPVASPAYAGFISNNTAAAAVDLVLTTGPIPTNTLVWRGTVSSNWDLSTSNWLASGGASAYSDGSLARFDDTATGPTNINLTTVLNPASVTVSNSALTYLFTGTGSLAGLSGLNKQGNGTLILDNTGANSFSGPVNVSGGTLQVGNNDSGGSFGSGNIVNNASLSFNQAGNFTVGNAISGAGSVSQNGAGTLTLAAANSYSGSTFANTGELKITGAISGGGTLTSAVGAVLAGTGTNSGPVVVNGWLQPGDTNSPGTLTTGNLTVNASAKVQFDVNADAAIGSGVNDLVQVNGSLTLNNNTVTINLLAAPQIGVTYHLVTYTGTLSGSFNPTLVIIGGSGYTAALDYGTPHQINLTFLSGQGSQIPASYPTGPGPMGITLGADGKLVYSPDTNGDIIPDFSNAGYMGGGVPIPTNIPVVTTLSPIAGDNSPQIQAAIDNLAAQPLGTNGFRGVIYLNPGVYTMSNGMSVSASGIVVRGAGDSTNGTVLELLAGHAIFTVNNPSGVGRSEVANTRHNVTTPYVPLGAKWFAVDSVSNWSVGDNVVIYRPSTAAWCAAINTSTKYPISWNGGEVDLNWERTIVAIEGNRVMLDAPLFCALDQQYGGGYVYKYTYTGRAQNIGLENIRAFCTAGTDTNGNTAGQLITFDGVMNCWVRGCMNDKMNGHTVSADSCKWCTFEDIISYHNPLPGGHSGSSIQINTHGSSQGLLFHRFTTSDGGFEFSSGGQSPGPNVVLESDIPHAFASTGPHMKWSVGTLYDAMFMHQGLSVLDAGGSHGWQGGNHVAWNDECSSIEFDRPATAHQVAVGLVSTASGPTAVRQGTFPTEVTSWGAHVDPRSLYRAQLAERLGAQPVLAALGQPYGDNYFVLTPGTNNLSAAPGQSTNVPVGVTVTANYPDRMTIPIVAGSVALTNWPGSNIVFSASGLPFGCSANFNVPSLNNTGTNVMNVVVSNTCPPGNYPLIVQGSSAFPNIRGGVSPLNSFGFVTLSVPGPNNFFLSTSSSQTIISGSNITCQVVVLASNGFSGTVALSITNLPPGVSAGFSPASVSGSGLSTLTLTAANNALGGNYTLTLIGSSGGQTCGATIGLTVISTVLPPPWLDADIGTQTNKGSGGYLNGAFIIKGSGADVWGTSDQFNYGYQPQTGDFAITARVVSQTVTGPWAKAGVMIRESTNVNSKYAFVIITPTSSHGASMQYRTTTGGSAADAADLSGPAVPYWVRVVRSGNTLTGYDSPDGGTWSPVGTNSITMSNGVLAGLAVCANSSSALCTATFDNVSIDYPSFTVDAAPDQQTVLGGQTTNFTVTVTSLFGFNGVVTLSANSLPNGSSAIFSPPTVTGSGTSTISITTSNATLPDSYSLTISGTSGQLEDDAGVALNVLPVDSDSDGIPDWWMLQYFGHATGQAGDLSRPGDDADGDGMSNWAEYLTGTDPTNPQSYLHLLSASVQGSDEGVSWTTVGGYSYVLQAATGLNATNGFTDISPVVTDSGDGESVTTYIEPGGATNGPVRFYRVRLGP